MRGDKRNDRINRAGLFAEENTNLSGHPAKDSMDEWRGSILNKTDDYEGESCKAPESAETRQQKIEAMDEVIKENIDNL